LKVQYFGTDKKRYQLEVPESAAKKAGDGYAVQNQKKGFKRFTTDRTKVCNFHITIICVID
jgi:DNA mismatch repair protein MSH6